MERVFRRRGALLRGGGVRGRSGSASVSGGVAAAEERWPLACEARPEIREGIAADADKSEGRAPDGAILAEGGDGREQQRPRVSWQHEPRRARPEGLAGGRLSARS